MARPLKKGLEYFPFDVDFSTNEKTEAISGEFGAKGVLIFVYLLSAVYRKGYYLQWSELVKNQIANRVDGATGELVELVVKRLVAYGTFDKDLFQSDNVLTSQRIQETYLNATKRRKTQEPTLYWINDDNNSASTGVNVYINPQSKVKESKVNKTKVNQTQTGPSVSSLEEEFTTQIWTKYPRQAGNFTEAQKAYVTAILTGGTTKEQVLAKIAEYKAYIDLNNIGEAYITAGSNWFTGQNWHNSWNTTKPEKRKEAAPNGRATKSYGGIEF